MDLANKQICNKPKNVAFGAKINTVELIQAATGRLLDEAKLDTFYKPFEILTGEKISKIDATNHDTCRQCVRLMHEYVSSLGNIIKEAKLFFNKDRSWSEVKKWTESQVKKIGSDEVDIPTLKEVAENTMKKEFAKKYSVAGADPATLYFNKFKN